MLSAYQKERILVSLFPFVFQNVVVLELHHPPPLGRHQRKHLASNDHHPKERSFLLTSFMRKNDTGWCDYVSVTRIKDHIKDLLILFRMA